MEVLPNVHVLRLRGAQAYLIVEDELTLIDAGHRGSGRIVASYLRRLGRRMDELTRIVCTHGHPDHIGGAHEIAAASGAQVFLHPADNERLRIKLRDVISNPSPGPKTPPQKHIQHRIRQTTSGTAESAHSVRSWPTRRDHTMRPNPTENRNTLTPARRATM